MLIYPRVCVVGLKATTGSVMMRNYLRSVGRIFRAFFAYTLIIYSLTACAGGVGSLLSDVLTGNSGGGDDIGDASSGESSSGSNATDSSSESSGSSSEDSGDGSSSGEDSGETNVSTPTVGLPSIPSLMADDTFAYASDSESEIPITGSSSDAIGSTVVVSTSSELATLVTTPRGIFGSLTRKYIIKDARAATTDEICSQDGVECCSVDESGTFESCFLSTTDSSVSKVYISLMDSSGNLGTATEIDVASNFHYLGETPQDVVIAGDYIYTITNGVAVKTTYNSENERFEVAGDHEDNYEDFTVDGSSISYGSTDSLLGVMSSSGITLFTVEDGTVSNSGETGCEASDDETPAIMKALNGIIYCGKSYVSATDEASLEYATTGERYIEDRHKNVKFLAPEDGLTAVGVLGYDSGTIEDVVWTVVAFSDGESIRLRAIERYGETRDTKTSIDTWKALTEITMNDVVFYHGQTTAADYTRFAILDSQNDKVWLGKVNVDSDEFDMNDDNVVAVGDNPVAMKLHNNKLYVLNAGGQSISVIRLFNADGTTPRRESRVSATLDLTSLISGRTLSFTPTSLAVSDGKLIIADQTKKALVVIDTDDITEESIDDESSDSTSTESETSSSTETDTSSSTDTESTSETATETETSTSTTTDTSTSSSTDTGSSSSTSTSSSTSSSSTETSTSTSSGSGRGGRR